MLGLLWPEQSLAYLSFHLVFFQTTGPIPTKLETTGETLPVWPPKRKEDLEGKFNSILKVVI